MLTASAFRNMSILIFMKAPSGPNKQKTKPKGKTAKPRTRRGEKKEQTKARILAAALALFRANGVEKTTAKQISTRAKIAEGTFFNYFPTKDDLALYFFQKGVD